MEVVLDAVKVKKHSEDTGRAEREFSLAQLATESGVPERTIRYYISRGILEGPARGGRGAFYTRQHLDRLDEIQRKQARGLTLAQIEMESAEQSTGSLGEPQGCWIYRVAPDVVVQVMSGLSPWRMRHVKSGLVKLAEYLQADGSSQGEGEGR